MLLTFKSNVTVTKSMSRTFNYHWTISLSVSNKFSSLLTSIVTLVSKKIDLNYHYYSQNNIRDSKWFLSGTDYMYVKSSSPVPETELLGLQKKKKPHLIIDAFYFIEKTLGSEGLHVVLFEVDTLVV